MHKTENQFSSMVQLDQMAHYSCFVQGDRENLGHGTKVKLMPTKRDSFFHSVF